MWVNTMFPTPIDKNSPDFTFTMTCHLSDTDLDYWRVVLGQWALLLVKLYSHG